MEYATTEAVEGALIVFRTYFTVIFDVFIAWSILSILLSILKMCISRYDKNGIIQNVLDIIKYLVLLFVMGCFTLLVSFVYNGDGGELEIINTAIILIPTLISIGIITIHKMFLKKKALNNVELNNIELNNTELNNDNEKLDKTAI